MNYLCDNISQLRNLFLGVLLVNLLNSGKNVVWGLNDANDLVLSPSEENAFTQFKSSPLLEQLPEEYMKTDFYLIRFLRYSNWNIDAAEEMLQKSLEWRIDNKIGQIKEENWDDMKLQFPVMFLGHDKENRPVMEMDIGNWNLKIAAEAGRSERVDRYMVWILEQLVSHIVLAQQETGKNVTRAVIIADAENLGFRQHLCSACISTLRRWNSVMEANYPGFYDEIIIIKAPTLTRLASKLISPFLSAETRRIIKTLSSGWMEYLDERIEKEERTASYGGTKPKPFRLVYNLVYFQYLVTVPQYTYILPNNILYVNPLA
ncbi:unnamed protein product [Orchesella dallaii]|uniref:CRAL-TRIO domain-containing protein n=1 Tax=Orchesella dallaii TaxID=48710 RepID=A0ABP1PYA5_9HEXA